MSVREELFEKIHPFIQSGKIVKFRADQVVTYTHLNGKEDIRVAVTVWFGERRIESQNFSSWNSAVTWVNTLVPSDTAPTPTTLNT